MLYRKEPWENHGLAPFSNFLMGPRSGAPGTRPLLCKVRRALGLEGPFYL